ncbi:MAG: fatty acid desaturase [Halieaceae bacterium]
MYQAVNYLDYEPKIDREVLRELSRKDAARSTFYLLLLAGVALGSFSLLVLLPSLASFVIVFLVIGVLQHHLLIVQHEALHLFLFNDRRANEYIGAVVSYLIGFTMRYRKLHFSHHRQLGGVGDPDLHNYELTPLTSAHLRKMLLLNLTGIAAITQFFRQSIGTKNVTENESFDWGVLGIVFTQLLLLVGFYAVGHVQYYFVFWLLPLITIAKTITNFRNMAEHLLMQGNTRYRTILCGGVEKLIFAPLNFNYHADHHLCLSVPYQNLPQLHEYLSKLDDYRDYVDVRTGYISTIRDALGKTAL